jgi:LacI family transcriptional regulator
MNKTSIERDPDIAILIGTSIQWGRQVIAGINQYNREHSPWHIFMESRGMDEILELPKDWRGDGVIARITCEKQAQQLKELGIPVVNISSIQVRGSENFPRVTTDNQLFTQLALNYFLDLGFNHLGYFSLQRICYIARQHDAFLQATEQAGIECFVYEAPPGIGAAPAWNLNIKSLRKWLKNLPKPIGILTWNATCARQIVYACEQEGLFVPDDVAVLSAVDDDLLCELSHSPLSAVDVRAKQIGYRAADLMDQLLHKKKVPNQSILIEPGGVITRQSTDTLAIKDQQLAAAIRFIRNHVTENIQVNDVARHAGLSRRVLERRFSQILSRTPAEEIRRVKLDCAKQLLVKTELPIPDIAEASGFGSPEYLAHVFRSNEKMTPLAYRKKNRQL